MLTVFVIIQEICLLIMVAFATMIRWFTLFMTVMKQPAFKIRKSDGTIIQYNYERFRFLSHRWVKIDHPISKLPDLTIGNWWIDFLCLDQPIIRKIDDNSVRLTYSPTMGVKTVGRGVNTYLLNDFHHIHDERFEILSIDGNLFERQKIPIKFEQIDEALLLSDIEDICDNRDINSFWTYYETNYMSQFILRLNLTLLILIPGLIISIINLSDEYIYLKPIGIWVTIYNSLGLLNMIPGIYKFYKSTCKIQVSIRHIVSELFITYDDKIGELRMRGIDLPAKFWIRIDKTLSTYLGLPGLFKVLIHPIFFPHLIWTLIVSVYKRDPSFVRTYWLIDPLMVSNLTFDKEL